MHIFASCFMNECKGSLAMDNQAFWSSISAIIRDGFDKEGTYKLKLYAKQLITGIITFLRRHHNGKR